MRAAQGPRGDRAACFHNLLLGYYVVMQVAPPVAEAGRVVWEAGVGRGAVAHPQQGPGPA